MKSNPVEKRLLNHSAFNYLPFPQKIVVEGVQEMAKDLHPILQSYNRQWADLDVAVHHFPIGEKELKQLGISPDGFLQVIPFPFSGLTHHSNPISTPHFDYF